MVVTTRISFHKCRESFLKMWRVCRIEGSFQAVPLEDLATAVKIARKDIGVNETLREPTKRRLISVGVLSLSKRVSMKCTTADDDSRQIQFVTGRDLFHECSHENFGYVLEFFPACGVSV